MDKKFRGKIIGMGIPVVLALIIITIVTLAQQTIIRTVARSLMRSRFARYLVTAPLNRGKVVPYYMYFIVLMAAVVLVSFIVMVTSRKLQDKPKAVVFPIVVYSFTVLFGTVYFRFGGDKLLHSKQLSSNVDVITYLLSIILTPVMIVYFVFFVLMIVSFLINANRLQKQNKGA